MPNVLHILRTRRFRLLASLLVMMAILCNGISLAQAQSAMAKKDCCAEMMGHKKSASPCADGSKPCPSPNTQCDDQCIARCMSANGILSVPYTILPSVLVYATLPQLKTAEHSLAEFGPGLRPPIYS
jgi:hypothetical protein